MTPHPLFAERGRGVFSQVHAENTCRLSCKKQKYVPPPPLGAADRKNKAALVSVTHRARDSPDPRNGAQITKPDWLNLVSIKARKIERVLEEMSIMNSETLLASDREIQTILNHEKEAMLLDEEH